MIGLLDGKWILVSGIIIDLLIVFYIVWVVQEQGVQLVFIGFDWLWLIQCIIDWLLVKVLLFEFDV